MNKSTLNDELTVVIPTFNEEQLLPRALESVSHLGVKVYVLDSKSSDRTVEVAEHYGCTVIVGEWNSFSEKLNFGFELSGITTPWLMRVDGDEYLTQELIDLLKSGYLQGLPNSVVGLWVPRRAYFMGRWMKHGGMYPQSNLRIVRRGCAKYENRVMDEHVIAEGETVSIQADMVDDPDRGLLNWLRKHLFYAEVECYTIYRKINKESWHELEGGARFRRYLKERVYKRLPLFIRPVTYWVYRYFLRLGFLDGPQGFIFHFLQAIWYRFVVDALLFEAKVTNGKSVKNSHKI